VVEVRVEDSEVANSNLSLRIQWIFWTNLLENLEEASASCTDKLVWWVYGKYICICH